jgi:hypothetical protein
MTFERGDAACPAEVLEAIPWYPDGLGDAQRGALEAHAATCAECRREIGLVRGEGGAEPALELPDADRVWRRVLELVAADAGTAAAEAPARPAPRTAQRRWLRASPGGLRLAAGLALALGAGALGAAVGARLFGEAPVYRTAAAPAAGAAAAGPALDVVFRGSATADEIQAALGRVGGAIVAGPSPLGVFRVALAPGSDAAAVAAALRDEAGGVATFAAAKP